ncbi:hypothetical protein V0M98_17735 [Pseudomonas silesiensis]|uniref:hypothetical protein n=1 Tax=Pseudomonas silesiensis TaxID=1853130 RepID=UPI0030D0F1DF
MSIPVNALKDDELLHYAALDPGAAAELSRRFAEGSIDPLAESEDLRDEIRMIESGAEDLQEQLENQDQFMASAADLIRKAMNPKTPQDQVKDLLEKAIGKLEG